tara:strand:- start:39373 stop:39633 length:261 start_codon:yes stop_codon:yes gene_type:complete
LEADPIALGEIARSFLIYSMEKEFFVPKTIFSGSDGKSSTVPFEEMEMFATLFSQSFMVLTLSAYKFIENRGIAKKHKYFIFCPSF